MKELPTWATAGWKSRALNNRKVTWFVTRPVGSGWVRLGGPTQLDNRRKSPTTNRLMR